MTLFFLSDNGPVMLPDQLPEIAVPHVIELEHQIALVAIMCGHHCDTPEAFYKVNKVHCVVGKRV